VEVWQREVGRRQLEGRRWHAMATEERGIGEIRVRRGLVAGGAP
jgi:hypothetical protein